MRIFFSFILFLLVEPLSSQRVLDYGQFTTDKGLSENVVYCVLQDKKGFIWAGTHHGINRYDGYSFRKFYSIIDDPTTLSQNEIHCMKEDATGKFWIGTGAGLNYFNPETGNNKRIGFNGKNKLGGVKDLFVLNNDSVLVLANHEIYLYSKSSNKWIQVMTTWPPPNIENFLPFTNDEVGFSCKPAKELFVYNSFTNRFNKSAYIPGTKIPIIHPVSSYFRDKHGNHFVFVLHKSIDVFNKDEVLIARLDKKLFPSLDFVLMCKFFAAASGDVWIATTNGLLMFDNVRKKFNTIELVGDSRSLKGNKEIRAMCIDKDQNLWLGLFGEGLLKCQISESPFASISLDLLARKNVPRMIFGLYSWRDGEIAAETGFKNLTIVKDGKVVGFVNSDSMSFTNIIFITTGKKVAELTLVQTTIAKRLFNNKKLYPKQFLLHDSNTILITAPNLIVVKEDTVFYKQGAYSTFMMDDGMYYWAPATNGLVRVSKKDLSDTLYTYEAGNPYSLNENYIYHVINDEKNNLWVGTKGGGLNYFNRAENRFYHYTMEDGLPDNVIYFILPDTKGNLWLTTNNGLSRFNIQAKTFTNYSRRDGLLNSEFNRNGGLEMEDGTFYFSGTNGIDYFHPSDVEKPGNTPAVFVSEIKINGKETSLADAIELKHSENNITISFTANDFTRSDLVYYRYRLQEADSWTRVQGNNSVTYNALPNKAYRFTVQSSFDNFTWSNEAVYAFIIQTPWWRTSWFYVSLMAIVAILLFTFYRYRINQLKKIMYLRSKISQDLHDEVGATLSSIHVYSSVAAKLMGKDEAKAMEALQQINQNTRQVMENMSDIVWAIKASDAGETTLAAKLKNYGYELLTPLNIQCVYWIDKEAEKKLTSMEARKNILLIAKEAMNNIAKYSNATEAMIRLECIEKNLQLEITDNGKGIDAGNGRTGNGLSNMKKRAEALGGEFNLVSEKGKGIRIQCQVPLANISD